MAVHFNAERMQRALDAHTAWWKGTLDRPLMSVIIHDAYPARRTAAPMLSQASCADFSWSPEQVIDAADAEFSRYEYLGDAIPMLNFSAFGPGVLAAFCGARLDNSTGGVWFWADQKREIEDIHAVYDPENKWVKRIKAIYRAGLEKWEGNVLMGMPDLGGVMDVASTLRGTEELLTDLYDAPDEVKRLVNEIQTAWYAAYDDLAAVLKPQGAFCDWSGLACREPSYIIQSDFSYMIGENMFREFVLDTLRSDAKRLANTIYHMDGVGQINHLDAILSVEELNAIQWQPGSGKPYGACWLDIYQKIQSAGKQLMIEGGPDAFLEVLSHVHGSPYAIMWLSDSQRDIAEKLIAAR